VVQQVLLNGGCVGVDVGPGSVAQVDVAGRLQVRQWDRGDGVDGVLGDGELDGGRGDDMRGRGRTVPDQDGEGTGDAEASTCDETCPLVSSPVPPRVRGRHQDLVPPSWRLGGSPRGHGRIRRSPQSSSTWPQTQVWDSGHRSRPCPLCGADTQLNPSRHLVRELGHRRTVAARIEAWGMRLVRDDIDYRIRTLSPGCLAQPACVRKHLMMHVGEERIRATAATTTPDSPTHDPGLPVPRVNQRKTRLTAAATSGTSTGLR